MLNWNFVARMAVAGVVALSAGAACGQDFPSKTIRIVAASVGSSGDFAARLTAQALSANVGQPVIVENRPGRVVIPVEIVMKSPADGYTLLLHGSSIWLLPYLRNDVTYDPVRDLAPVTIASAAPNILVLHPSVPAKNVKELIALARANPGVLNYSSTSIGGSSHLAAELFKSMAKVNIVRVPYRSGAQETADLIAGQIQLAFGSASALTPHIKTGKLRGVAVTTAKPSVLIPGLPTIAASGLPGYEAVSILGIFAPAKTPSAVINRLHQEIARAINQPDIKEKFHTAGVEIGGDTPAQFGALVKSEMAKWSKLFKEAGIRDES